MGLVPAKLGDGGAANSDANIPDIEAVPAASLTGETDTAAAGKIEPAIGKFLRSWHVLLRAVRLYQRNHPRVTESLEAVDRELRIILTQVPALSLKVDGSGIIATTRLAPRSMRLLPDPRGELKTLAAELAVAGISSLILLRRINLGELALLAHALDAATRHSARKGGGRNWAAWLAEHQIGGLQVNASLQRREETALALLVAALPAQQASDATIASTLDQIRESLCFLQGLEARLEQAQHGSPQEAARAIRAEVAVADAHTLFLVARAAQHDPPLDGDSPAPYLARLADTLAIDFVGAEYVADRLRPSEVRTAVASLEERTGQDAAQEARAEARIERFWAALPARSIARVLSGAEAWCLPVSTLRRYLAPLLAAAERKGAGASGMEARRAVASLVRCLDNERDSVRRAVAAALVEMSDVLARIWPHSELAGLETTIISVLAEEKSPAPGVLLASVLEILARLALERRSYGLFEKIVNELEAVPAGSRDAIQPLLRRLSENRYWMPLADAAMANRALDPALPRLLGRDPTRLLDRLGLLLITPEGASALPAMARLIRAMDNNVIRALETDLSGSRRQRVATAIKLLSAAAPERLAAALPRSLADWDWSLQDLAVTELARQDNPSLRRQVARVFLDLLDEAHLHVAPGMIDLIALAQEDWAVPGLLEMACGDTIGAQDTFVRIKAVEALGRLRAASAAPRLRELASKRSGLTYAYPAGLRSAAAEALTLMEGGARSAASAALPGTPGDGDGRSSPFSRQRRYQRVTLESPLPANIESAKGVTVRVRAIALGGALVETGSRLAIGDLMHIEIHAGLGRIRSTAVVRNANPEGYGVEFVHMEQEDRERLRRRLVKLLQ